MNSQSAQRNLLENDVAQVPNQFADVNVKHRLTEIARRMDQVGRLDPHSQEVYLDEASIRSVLQATGSPSFEQQSLKALLATQRVISDPHKSAQMTAIGWREVASRTFNTNHLSTATFASLGVNNSTTPDELLTIAKQHLPTVPEKIFEPGQLSQILGQLLQRPLGAEQAASAPVIGAPAINVGGVEVCVENHIGFWAAVSIMGIIVCLAVTFPNVLLGLALAGIWTGFWALAVILTCCAQNL